MSFEEIAEKFMETFNIKPKRSCYWSNTHCKDCNEDCVNFYIKPEYPQITSDILLELICILVNFGTSITLVKGSVDTNVEALKRLVLNAYITTKGICKEQVRSLFEGVEQ